MKDLLNFTSQEEKIKEISSFIRKLLEANPTYTAYDINKKLRNRLAYIKKGVLYHTSPSEKKEELDEDIRQKLDHNFRTEIVKTFRPATPAERELLLQIYKLKDSDADIPLFSIQDKRDSDVTRLRELFTLYQGRTLRDYLKEEGYSTKRIGDRVVVFDLKLKRVYDLKSYGINPEKLYVKNHSANYPLKDKKTAIDVLPDKINPGRGSAYSDREWEVGTEKDRDNDLSQGGVNY